MADQPACLEGEPGHGTSRVAAQLAAPVQEEELLPVLLPSHPRLQFGRSWRAGRHQGVDYHDVLNLGGNRFAIVMADLSGAGARAAAVSLQRTLRGHAGRHDDAGSLLHRMGELFGPPSNGLAVATGICAVVDIRRRLMRLACAGHPAPLLAREGTPAMPLLVHSLMPLGRNEVIVTSECELRSGDALLFYTDGAIHRQNGDGDRYGIERLRSALLGARVFPPTVAVDCLAGEIDGFAGGHDPTDDQTLLLVRVG